MEMNSRMLLAVGAIGVLSLIIFAQMLAPSANAAAQGNGNGQNQINLGAGSPATTGPEQVVEVRALGTGLYDKREIHVKAGQPVRFRFSAEASSGCGRQLVIPDYGVNLISRNGETAEAVFTPQKGAHAYRCGMNMFRGVLYAD